MNILLVESSTLYKDILQRALQGMSDLNIDQVGTAAQAWQALQHQSYQFFVLAGQFDDGTGIELARALRVNAAAATAPIVVLTSSASAEMAQAAALAGVTELFRKQDIDELVRFMRHYIDVQSPMHCRVLYVEDANDQRALLTAALTDWGMQVDAFASADEAWKAFPAGRYDLVLCDVVLSGAMSGARLINRIRRLPVPLGATPLLAVTAFDNPARRIELFQLGVDDYVQKPILLEELRVRIFNLLSRKRALERNQILLAATALGVVYLSGDGVVTAADDNAENLFRAPEKGLLGRAWHELLCPLSVSIGEDIWHTLARGESIHGQHLAVRRLDGTVCPVELTGLEVAEISDQRQYVLLLRDTEQEHALAEKLVQAKVAAESAERLKSEFMANMSHEIRTPLNAIIGLSHLLKQLPIEDEVREHIGRIDSAGQQLLELVNSVLDLARIGAGKLQLESHPVKPESLLDEVAGMIAEKARQKGVAIRIETEALPSGLMGDPLRLRQALLNYAANAVKFTEAGQVDLRCRIVERQARGVTLCFEVEDSGIGIAPEQLPSLFAAFRQVDGSASRRFGGVGLGLALTRELAERMKGTVGVRSTLGSGSVFWFTAFLEYGQGRALATAPVNLLPVAEMEKILRESFAGTPVLLVEDNAINREVAQALLGRLGLVVDLAEDGEEAVLKAGSNRYALILMDLRMPRMDGFQATELILKQGRAAKAPIVALTANALPEERTRCLAAGMKDFISKPIKPEVLYAVLLRWLREID